MMTRLRFWWWLMVREPANVRVWRRTLEYASAYPEPHVSAFVYGWLTPTEREYCAWIGLGKA